MERGRRSDPAPWLGYLNRRASMSAESATPSCRRLG